MTAPRDPEFEQRVRASFARQRFMATLGATLDVVQPGEVHIGFTHREELTQQHGYLHAGVLASVADSACGYAALSLMPADSEVLSVEFKVNLLRPATGERFIARAEVLKPGRTLTVARADVFAITNEQRTLVAAMQGTMIARM